MVWSAWFLIEENYTGDFLILVKGAQIITRGESC